MTGQKTTFALFFGNRGFFPPSLIEEAREEIPRVLKQAGHDVLMMEAGATAHGGVETPQEAKRFAGFLEANRGRFGGVILSLPNFGDENGAAIALKDAGVPIFIQAYPDDLDRMGPAQRRDSFCGKISIMDVFAQNGIPFTTAKPHVVKPSDPKFAGNIDFFDRVCRVAGGMRRMVVGAIGARTTPFKTVRVDEVTLQRKGITVETFDLADVFGRMKGLRAGTDKYRAKQEHLRTLSDWNGVPDSALDGLVRLAVVLDEMVEEHHMAAISIRCWTELQAQFGISPCVVTGDLMERHLPAACEVDTASAVVMRMLGLASGEPTMILDWNNNYGDDEDKCILFHCGNVPSGLMSARGRVTDHAILRNTVGEGRGFGCNSGRIAPMDFTFGNLMTDPGGISIYLGHGSFTDDPIPSSFFGCAGVARIEKLQDVLAFVGRAGHRHHVALTPGLVRDAIVEAAERYLGFRAQVPQRASC